jgi:hypothetical protein
MDCQLRLCLIRYSEGCSLGNNRHSLVLCFGFFFRFFRVFSISRSKEILDSSDSLELLVLHEG